MKLTRSLLLILIFVLRGEEIPFPSLMSHEISKREREGIIHEIEGSISRRFHVSSHGRSRIPAARMSRVLASYCCNGLARDINSFGQGFNPDGEKSRYRVSYRIQAHSSEPRVFNAYLFEYRATCQLHDETR